MYSYTDSVVTTELCYKISCLYKLHVIMFMTFDRFPSAYYRRKNCTKNHQIYCLHDIPLPTLFPRNLSLYKTSLVNPQISPTSLYQAAKRPRLALGPDH